MKAYLLRQHIQSILLFGLLGYVCWMYVPLLVSSLELFLVVFLELHSFDQTQTTMMAMSELVTPRIPLYPLQKNVFVHCDSSHSKVRV